jgi:hypothetical protein
VVDSVHELAQVVGVALFLGIPPGDLQTKEVIESVWQQTLPIAKRTPSKYWRFTSRLRERRVLDFAARLPDACIPVICRIVFMSIRDGSSIGSGMKLLLLGCTELHARFSQMTRSAGCSWQYWHSDVFDSALGFCLHGFLCLVKLDLVIQYLTSHLALFFQLTLRNSGPTTLGRCDGIFLGFHRLSSSGSSRHADPCKTYGALDPSVEGDTLHSIPQRSGRSPY